MTLAGVRYFRTVEADESFDFFATKCEVVPFGKNNLISYGSYLGYIYSSNSRDCQQLPAPVVTGANSNWRQQQLATVPTPVHDNPPLHDSSLIHGPCRYITVSLLFHSGFCFTICFTFLLLGLYRRWRSLSYIARKEPPDM